MVAHADHRAASRSSRPSRRSSRRCGPRRSRVFRFAVLVASARPAFARRGRRRGPLGPSGRGAPRLPSPSRFAGFRRLGRRRQGLHRRLGVMRLDRAAAAIVADRGCAVRRGPCPGSSRAGAAARPPRQGSKPSGSGAARDRRLHQASIASRYFSSDGDGDGDRPCPDARRGRCGRCGGRNLRGGSGTSKLKTWLTAGISRPRAATSEATRRCTRAVAEAVQRLGARPTGPDRRGSARR